MRVYGLTGGIASGKSTVARHLLALGANIVDADAIARDMVRPGSPALGEISATFGSQYVRDDGHLDRVALGELIFGDDSARLTLNKILHPRIAEASKTALNRLRAKGNALAIYEAPLLVENNLHQTMDGLIVVSLPPDIQSARLQKRDKIDKRAAEERIESQLPLSDKLALADFVIDNSQSELRTKTQVEALWQLLNNQIPSDM